MEFLIRLNLMITAAIASIFMMEYAFAARIALNSVKYSKNFTCCGLNPKTLSDEQKMKKPVVLVHGACHGHGVWKDFAESLQRSDVGPVFTVKVGKFGRPSENDVEIVKRKIDEIKSLYDSDMPVDLVGYSRGGQVVVDAAEKHHKDVAKVISLGYVPSSNQLNKSLVASGRYFEMAARYDFLFGYRPTNCGENHHGIANIGHLGLPFHLGVHQQIIEWLKQPSASV